MTPPSPADVQNGVSDGVAKDIALNARYDGNWYYCWLIERRDGTQPRWLGEHSWETNANDALWFARRSDAEADVAHNLKGVPQIVVCEHGFMLNASSASATAPPTEAKDIALPVTLRKIDGRPVFTDATDRRISPYAIIEKLNAKQNDEQHLVNIAQMLDTLKSQDWKDCWSTWDQEQRDWITNRLSEPDCSNRRHAVGCYINDLVADDIGFSAEDCTCGLLSASSASAAGEVCGTCGGSGDLLHKHPVDELSCPKCNGTGSCAPDAKGLTAEQLRDSGIDSLANIQRDRDVSDREATHLRHAIDVIKQLSHGVGRTAK